MASAEEPLPTIATAGMRLRPWRLADAVALRDACGDPSILRFTTVPRAYSPIAAQDWIRRQHARAAAGEAVVLAIVPDGEARPVGMVGLFGLAPGAATGRLGYWMIGRARSRGLTTAASRALVAWGFDRRGLNAIFIDVEPGNAASARVATKLGAIAGGTRTLTLEGEPLSLVRHVLVAP